MKRLLILFLLILSGCASVENKGFNDFERDSRLKMRDYASVLKDMEAKLPYVDKKDLLMWKLNYASVLHQAGEYKKSNDVFRDCQGIIDWDHNLTAEEKVLDKVVSSNLKKFRLMDYEILTISTLKMINSLLLGEMQNALAESRKLNRMQDMMGNNSSLARDIDALNYFSGIVWESQREVDYNALDNAYIDYKKVQRVHPSFPYINYDLYRTAVQTKRFEDAQRWKDLYGIPSEYKKQVLDEDMGELIVIFEYGNGPRKRPNRTSGDLMLELIPKTSFVGFLSIQINEQDFGHTLPLINIDNLAEKNFNDYRSGFLGGLGNLTGFYSDHDLRSWDLIPKEIQIARIPLKKGEYNLNLLVEGDGQYLTDKVKIIKKQKTLVYVGWP